MICLLGFKFQSRLKTVISVGVEEANPAFLSFLEDRNIRFESANQSTEKLKLGTNSEDDTGLTTYSELVISLRIMLNASSHPLLIVDESGKDRTGLVVACLRKTQKWDLEAINQEYTRHTKVGLDQPSLQLISCFESAEKL